MEIDLGPCSADDMIAWTKMARRIVVEIKGVDGEIGINPDLAEPWSRLIDAWAQGAQTARAADHHFRSTETIEPDMAEFLLHGLDQCLHSPQVAQWVTQEEASAHRGTTMMIVRAFTDALWEQGSGCQHFADQVLASLGTEID